MLIRASSLYRALGDREAETRAEAEIGRVYLGLGEASQGIPRLEAALAGAREGGDLKAGSRALAAATSILARLHWSKGDLDASLAAGDNRVLAEAETRRGTILQNMGGHAEEAQATLDGAIAVAEEAGALDVVASAAIKIAVGFWTEGRFDRAESYVRRAVAACERLGDPHGLAFALHVLALVLFGRGNWKEARELAERAVRLSDAVGHSWGRPYVLWALAVLNVFEGRWDAATLLRERVARAWIELGDASSAETVAREVVGSAREKGFTLAEAWTLPTLGCALARQGRSAEAQEVFERAIELSRAMPEPLNEAITRHEWGRMLAEAGGTAGAREQLGAALTLFRGLGTQPFIERSERILVSLQSSEETRTTR